MLLKLCFSVRVIVFFQDSLEEWRLKRVDEVEEEVSVDVILHEVSFIRKELTQLTMIQCLAQDILNSDHFHLRNDYLDNFSSI